MNAIATIIPAGSSNEDTTMPATAAASIDWRPLSAVPDDRKDGRDVLLWAAIGQSEYAAVGAWCDGRWVDMMFGKDIVGATHFADVEGPQS